MTEKVAVLLRGVNVGGHKVEMAKLRAVLGAAGYLDVATYLQSGNVVLSVEKPDEQTAVVASIESIVAAEFGFECRALLRSSAQLARCRDDDPLLTLAEDPARHLVGFLSGEPEPRLVDELTAPDYGMDRIEVVGDHLYMWCPAGFSQSPFFKMKLDRALGVVVTARNWNTVLKLLEMTGGAGTGRPKAIP